MGIQAFRPHYSGGSEIVLCQNDGYDLQYIAKAIKHLSEVGMAKPIISAAKSSNNADFELNQYDEKQLLQPMVA